MKKHKSHLHYAILEYVRPWKIITFAFGLGLLVIGSFVYDAPDWDVPISFIMATLTYFTAPWSARVVLNHSWKNFPVMLFVTWFAVDGCYWIYWSLMNPPALEMRDVNFWASLSLYWICGVFWFYQGSLKDLLEEVQILWNSK